MCGGTDDSSGGVSVKSSQCLGDDVLSAAKESGINVVGVSGSQGCGVDANGGWWQGSNLKK
jgi:hypothetical protein